MSKILFNLGGGIGNIIQAMPAVKAIYSEGHVVDLWLHCNSSTDLSIFKTDYVNNIFRADDEIKEVYDFQLNGNFVPSTNYSKKNINPTVRFSRHEPEAEFYYNAAKQIGITTIMEDVRINIGNKGPSPKHPDTVVIYPGSKHNWAMKRWDKYDELAIHFKHVTITGTKDDIYSQGKPTWIEKKWNWPKHAEILLAPLEEIAYYISQCKMFIGNDGGLAHVAAATGIETHVLFGPSSPQKNKPYSSKAHVIAIDLPCRPCQYKEGTKYLLPNKGNCPLNMKCMREMSVEHVLKMCNFS